MRNKIEPLVVILLTIVITFTTFRLDTIIENINLRILLKTILLFIGFVIVIISFIRNIKESSRNKELNKNYRILMIAFIICCIVTGIALFIIINFNKIM